MRVSVLLLALAVSAPAIWAALGTQHASVESALLHFLVAVPVMAVLTSLVRLAARPPDSTHSQSANRPTTEDD